MNRKPWLGALFIAVLISCFALAAYGQSGVPGQWGTTDTSRPESIEWTDTWAGAKNLRAQWYKILAESPEAWQKSGYVNHAKGEPPDNTYYLWRYDKPLPEGTKILIEGDFPHARMMSFQVTQPWGGKALTTSDGLGLIEVHLLDQDIVPDPGHTNPFLPGADRNAKKRHFHITFELRDGDPLTLNPKAVVPPYRAPGNLRIGGTGTAAPGSLFGKPKTHGPAVYVRVYLPDRYEPFGGVEPPVIRIQLPGQKPVLAPISRGMPVNLQQFVQGYAINDNPALENGWSVKEEEAQERIRAYARESVAKSGTPGTVMPFVHRLFAMPDGVMALYKNFQTAYLITYFRDYLAAALTGPTTCATDLPRRYRAAFGEMGPDARPPGNDEEESDHHLFNTYLVGSANIGPGQFFVFHGKAPRTPRTLKGDAVMGPSDELRYWNITLQCGVKTKLTPVINITDEQVVVGKDGYYTIVIGQDKDRPANATEANGITWRTWSVGAQLSILIRVMSTGEKTWEHAPQLITWQEGDYCELNKNPRAVRARMGEYYYESRYLSKAQIEALARGEKWSSVVGAAATAPTPKPAAAAEPAKAPAAKTAAGGRNRTLEVDGRTRTYRLHLPASYQPPTKLAAVIVLHGGQMNGGQMESLTGMSALADRESFAAVYPDSFGLYQGKPYWNDGRLPDVDDVKFIGALIDELTTNGPADPGRIYVTGISNGASMTNRVAIELAGKIAAVAPVAGTIGLKAAETQHPSRAVPVVYFHGTTDPMAYYTGGSIGTYRGSSLSAEDFVKWWARQDGCGDKPEQEELPLSKENGTRVTRIRYTGGRDNAEVVFYRIENGGHTWPGRPGLKESIFGRTTSQVDANAVMWEFFKRHARN